MLKKIMVAMILLGTISLGVAADWSGTYVCKGHDPRSNLNYRGALRITKQHDFYNLSWILSNGEEAKGRGFIKNKVLSAAYLIMDNHNPEAEPNFGVEQYTINPKTEELTGYWLEHNQKTLGTEICKRHYVS